VRVSRVERAAVVFWLLAGFAVWNGVFELHVTRGAKEYLFRQARHELGLGPSVTMGGVMRRTARDGAVAATLWGGAVAAAGVGTVLLVAGWARRRDTLG
jgi:hypothetical protein